MSTKHCRQCGELKCNHCRCTGSELWRCRSHEPNEPCHNIKYNGRLKCNSCVKSKFLQENKMAVLSGAPLKKYADRGRKRDKCPWCMKFICLCCRCLSCSHPKHIPGTKCQFQRYQTRLVCNGCGRRGGKTREAKTRKTSETFSTSSSLQTNYISSSSYTTTAISDEFDDISSEMSTVAAARAISSLSSGIASWSLNDDIILDDEVSMDGKDSILDQQKKSNNEFKEGEKKKSQTSAHNVLTSEEQSYNSSSATFSTWNSHMPNSVHSTDRTVNTTSTSNPSKGRSVANFSISTSNTSNPQLPSSHNKMSNPNPIHNMPVSPSMDHMESMKIYHSSFSLAQPPVLPAYALLSAPPPATAAAASHTNHDSILCRWCGQCIDVSAKVDDRHGDLIVNLHEALCGLRVYESQI
jgi:hypothetical protein